MLFAEMGKHGIGPVCVCVCVCVENEFCFGHTEFKVTVKARETYLSSQIYMFLEL